MDHEIEDMSGEGAGVDFRRAMAVQREDMLCAGFDGEHYFLINQDNILVFAGPEALERVAKRMLKDAKLWRQGKLKPPPSATAPQPPPPTPRPASSPL